MRVQVPPFAIKNQYSKQANFKYQQQNNAVSTLVLIEKFNSILSRGEFQILIFYISGNIHRRYRQQDFLPLFQEPLQFLPLVCSGCSEKFEMNKYDKDSKTNEKEFFKSSVRTYAGLRNALFHSNKFFEYFDEEGKYSKNTNDSGHLIFKHKIKITDCCYNLHKLVMYVGLKYAGFNSEIYNWSSWWKRTPA